MNNVNQKVEVLAPAGSYESLKAAVNAGCDAVYVGGSKFGARAFANNLQKETMLEAIDFVHLHNKKIYMTVNTLLKESEMDKLYDYLLPYYEAGLDAVIVQDFGVLNFVSEQFKNLPIHASTQMTLTSSYGINLLEEMGVTRLVPARELALEEIKDLRKHTNVEIETFVHGALCYCYSGQCLLSSMIGGRSGNRGRCAQPCRMIYGLDGEKKKNPYKLSPKDICTLDLIPELIEAGVQSFKIEGRMKRAEYTAYTAYLYGKYVNLYLDLGKEGYAHYIKQHKKEKELEIRNLMDLYNRGSFTKGYYTQYNGIDMMSMLRPNHNGVLVGKVSEVKGTKAKIILEKDIYSQDVLEFRNEKEVSLYDYTVKEGKKSGTAIMAPFKGGSHIKKGDFVYRTKNQTLLSEIEKEWILNEKKVPIMGKIIAKAGKPLKLIFTDKNRQVPIEISCEGDMVETPERQPVTKEKLCGLVNKIADTNFVFEALQVQMPEDIFVPVGKVKMLRREAINQIENQILKFYRREAPTKLEQDEIKNQEKANPISFFTLVSTSQQLEAVLERKEIDRIGLEVDTISEKEAIWMAKEIKKAKKLCFLSLPRIYRKGISDTFLTYSKDNIDGYLVRSLEQIGLLKAENNKKTILTDFNLYTLNKESKRFLKKLGIEEFTSSIELNNKELKEALLWDSSLVVYGHLPLMVSAQCLIKNQGICEKEKLHKKVHILSDRISKEYFVMNHCKHCYNIIYDKTPLSLLEEREQVLELNPAHLRMDFTIETKEETEKILKYFVEKFRYNKKTGTLKETTKGHFYRGIE